MSAFATAYRTLSQLLSLSPSLRTLRTRQTTRPRSRRRTRTLTRTTRPSPRTSSLPRRQARSRPRLLLLLLPPLPRARRLLLPPRSPRLRSARRRLLPPPRRTSPRRRRTRPKRSAAFLTHSVALAFACSPPLSIPLCHPSPFRHLSPRLATTSANRVHLSLPLLFRPDCFLQARLFSLSPASLLLPFATPSPLPLSNVTSGSLSCFKRCA